MSTFSWVQRVRKAAGAKNASVETSISQYQNDAHKPYDVMRVQVSWWDDHFHDRQNYAFEVVDPRMDDNPFYDAIDREFDYFVARLAAGQWKQDVWPKNRR